MKGIYDIDPNYRPGMDTEKDNAKFYNIFDAPIKIYGLLYEGDRFYRMPTEVAENVSAGVEALNQCATGGRVRFITDSSYVIIKVKRYFVLNMPHFALTGSCGFDMYAKEDGKEYYKGSFVPHFNLGDDYDSIINLNTRKLREITINFPLYSGVKELYIGIEDNAVLKEPMPYVNERPIIYYGSSITQGGCASRPGACYQAIVSRKFNVDYVNLGFSGSAAAQDSIADYIAGLDMGMFVYDYDHNASTPEYLKSTHKKMFDKVRAKHVDIPIIMMSRPKYYFTDEELERVEVIKETYYEAIKNGDKNVYMLTGRELMAICKDEGTVDNCHPTDLGFYSMACALCDLMEKNNIKVL